MFSMFSMTGIQSEYQQQVEAYGGRTATYQVKPRDKAWMTVSEPNMAGTPNSHANNALESINIDSGQLTLEYSSHVSNDGWHGYVRNGNYSGLPNQGKHTEAVRIRLVNASGWSVYYRVYMRGLGWGPFVKNDEMAGTTGQNRPIESIQVYVVPDNMYATQIIYDSTAASESPFPAVTLNTAFVLATQGFRTNFGVNFVASSPTLNTTILNGNSCPFTSRYNPCNTACGSPLSQCGFVHHKSSSVLHSNLISLNSNDYVLGIVAHRICRDSVHEKPLVFDLLGSTGLNRKHVLVTMKRMDGSNTNLAILIQHELSHSLGAKDHAAKPQQPCIMSSDLNNWCDACTNDIWVGIRNR
ncbi:MAG: hypothetical protein FWG83_07075 [Oscillospiraceae bacterium]|nr:hypothetical protein [Oscillospiraceae bacterium]